MNAQRQELIREMESHKGGNPANVLPIMGRLSLSIATAAEEQTTMVIDLTKALVLWTKILVGVTVVLLLATGALCYYAYKTDQHENAAALYKVK